MKEQLDDPPLSFRTTQSVTPARGSESRRTKCDADANETPGQAQGDKSAPERLIPDAAHSPAHAEKPPRLSIIVPVYNVEKWLPACLESIAAQTFRDFECILVDDGTPDGSGAICDEWAAQDARFRVIHQANAGVSAARNAGLDAARGEWIAFVDSDDTIEPVMYEELLAAADREGADLVCCGFLWDFGDENKNKASLWSVPNITRAGMLEEVINHDGFLPGVTVNKIARRSLYTENNIRFPTGVIIHEDNFVSFPLVFHAKKSALVNKPFYRYNQQNVSSTLHANSVPPQKNADDIISALNTVIELYRTDSTIPERLIRRYIEIQTIRSKCIMLLVCRDAARFRATYPEYNKLRYLCCVRGLSTKVWYALGVLRLEHVAFTLQRVKRALQGRKEKNV